MKWLPLDYDPLTGETTWHAFDGERNYLKTTQDVEPILDVNKTLYNHDDKGWSKTREWRRVASVPNSVIMKWKTEEGIDFFNKDHWEAVKRKLNSNEWLYLRTAPGRV